MPPAARVTDMHTCPMVTVLVPHVGGPILPPGVPNVLIGFLPAATVTNMCTCVGPPDVIIKGSTGVLINYLPAARLGDTTAHGGVIVLGDFTVIIGETGGGGAGPGGGGGAAGAASASAGLSQSGVSDTAIDENSSEYATNTGAFNGGTSAEAQGSNVGSDVAQSLPDSTSAAGSNAATAGSNFGDAVTQPADQNPSDAAAGTVSTMSSSGSTAGSNFGDAVAQPSGQSSSDAAASMSSSGASAASAGNDMPPEKAQIINDQCAANGITDPDLQKSYVAGSDPKKPVTKEELPPDTVFDMWVRDNGKPGLFCAPPGTDPSTLGINTAGRHLEQYKVKPGHKLTVVKSTAADFESGKIAGVGGKGGGTQYMLPPNWQDSVDKL